MVRLVSVSPATEAAAGFPSPWLVISRKFIPAEAVIPTPFTPQVSRHLQQTVDTIPEVDSGSFGSCS